MKKVFTFHTGDIFYADLGNMPCGSEQGGKRPVLIMQNDAGCIFSPTVTIVPITSNLKKISQPTHYVLQKAFFLKRTSMVLGEAVSTIDKNRILFYMGKLEKEDMDGASAAVRENLGFTMPDSMEAP